MLASGLLCIGEDRMTYEDQIMCYCANITDKDIDAIIEACPKDNIEGIMMRLPWTRTPDCAVNNPTGQCCKGEIRKYILKAM